jgi:hypothetical protein
MKIGMMCLWNAANGPSIHAELVGRAWVKMGHQLRVFSAAEHPDARPTDQRDEGYVIRHFRVDHVVPNTRASTFDPLPLLEEDYDVFVAQNVERLPAERLLRIFGEIKKKAVTVAVVHEGKAPEDPLYYDFEWDALVGFDERYKEYLVKSFPVEKIHLVPYPFHSLKLGNKRQARENLGFKQDERIVFSFGFRPSEVGAVLPALGEVAKKYPLKYVVIANPGSELGKLTKDVEKYEFLELRVRPLPLEELYTYLHASDVLLIHRESSTKGAAVVSSTVCQVLGSGCPILFHDSNYVEHHGEEIVKYQDLEDMKSKLVDLFHHPFDTKRIETFLESHDAQAIARRFVRLFEELLAQREGRVR